MENSKKIEVGSTVTDWLKPVWYDKAGAQIFCKRESGGDRHVADIEILDVRGWGELSTALGEDEAVKVMDEIGQFIADAINEKLTLITPAQSDEVKAEPSSIDDDYIEMCDNAREWMRKNDWDTTGSVSLCFGDLVSILSDFTTQQTAALQDELQSWKKTAEQSQDLFIKHRDEAAQLRADNSALIERVQALEALPVHTLDNFMKTFEAFRNDPDFDVLLDQLYRRDCGMLNDVDEIAFRIFHKPI